MKIIANVYIPFFITVKKLLYEKFSRPKLCTKFDVNYTYYDMDYIFYNPWFFPKYDKRVFEQLSNLAKRGLGFSQGLLPLESQWMQIEKTGRFVSTRKICTSPYDKMTPLNAIR